MVAFVGFCGCWDSVLLPGSSAAFVGLYTWTQVSAAHVAHHGATFPSYGRLVHAYYYHNLHFPYTTVSVTFGLLPGLVNYCTLCFVRPIAGCGSLTRLRFTRRWHARMLYGCPRLTLHSQRSWPAFPYRPTPFAHLHVRRLMVGWIILIPV